MTRIAITGSFDLFHNGHYDIVQKASKIFNEIVIIVGNNSNKNQTHYQGTRCKLIREQLGHLNNVTIYPQYNQLMINDLKDLEITTIVKGVRNYIDFEYERTMGELNNRLDETINTIFIPSDPRLSIISSSAYKELVRLYADPAWMVSKTVHDSYTKILMEEDDD